MNADGLLEGLVGQWNKFIAAEKHLPLEEHIYLLLKYLLCVCALYSSFAWDFFF